MKGLPKYKIIRPEINLSRTVFDRNSKINVV